MYRQNITKIISAVIFLAASTVTLASDNNNTAEPIYPDDQIHEQIDSNSWKFYKLELDNPAKLTIKLRKLSDDVDLYVAKTQKPTTSEYLCAPRKSGKRIETCRLSAQKYDVLYIGIFAKADSDYQLGVSARDIKLLSWSDYKQ